MKTFAVSRQCLDLGLRAGAVVFRDIHIEAASPSLRSEINDEVRRIRARYGSVSDIRSLPELMRHHTILRSVGVKPRSYPPSTQRLLELALKRGELPAINNLVDAYNLVSIRSCCSLGAHDMRRLTTPVELRLFDGDESFRPLGRTEDKPICGGEFGYVDAQRRVICRLDCLQADFSKVVAETTDALLIIESTDHCQLERFKGVFAEAIAIIADNCGGSAEIVS